MQLILTVALPLASRGDLFTVRAVIPSNAASDVVLDANIVAEFSAPAMASTMTSNRFFLHGEHGGLRKGAISFNSATNEFTLDPTLPLWPGERIFAELTTGITNAAGTNALTPYVWSFQAGVTNGPGWFLRAGQWATAPASATRRAVSLGDLDNDGDLDAAVAPNDENWYAFANNGRGDFTNLLCRGTTRSSSQNARCIALGDLNGDGWLDAFVAVGSWIRDSASDSLVLLNDGHGVLSDSGQYFNGWHAQWVALGDVEGDGDLDAWVVGGWPAYYHPSPALFINNGQGAFSASLQSLRGAAWRCVRIGDLDGDGDLDAMLASGNSSAMVLTNNGLGVFSEYVQTLPSNTVGVMFGDLDADLDLDAVFLASSSNTIWWNNGRAVFTNSGQGLGSSTNMAGDLGDVDADGDLDLIIVNGQTNRLWRNNGHGVFSLSSVFVGVGPITGVGLGDLDQDGDVDLYAARANDASGDVVLLNEGPTVTNAFPSPNTNAAPRGANVVAQFGATVNASSISNAARRIHGTQRGYVCTNASWNGATNELTLRPPTNFFAGELVTAEITRDARRADGRPIPYYNWSFRASVASSGASFGKVWENTVYSSHREVGLGDFDNDGDIDACVPGITSYGCLTYRNDGNAQFTAGSFGSGYGCLSVATGDLDGDGFMDAVVGSGDNKGISIFRGGSGLLTGMPCSPGINWPVVDLALGDLDGDGRLDAVVCPEVSGAVTILLNTGEWYAPLYSMLRAGPAIWASGRRVAIADLDGDGMLDVVVGADDQTRVLLNSASMQFTATEQILPACTSEIACGDMNNDGKADLVFGSSIWTNNGVANFGSHQSGLPSGGWVLGDMNGDDFLDGLPAGSNSKIHLNDGHGHLQAYGPLLDVFWGAALGDLNGDGTLDPFLVYSTWKWTLLNVWPVLCVQDYAENVVSDDVPASPAHGTDFGEVALGRSARSSFTITNSAISWLGMPSWTTNGTGAAQFSVTGVSTSLNAHSVTGFSIRFMPTVAGIHTATVVIVNNSSNNPFRIHLRGEAFASPFVINTTPRNASNSVARSANLIARFDRALNGWTINSNAFLLHGGQSGWRRGLVTVDAPGGMATLDPDAESRPGEWLTAAITRAGTNAAGYGLSPYLWSFHAAVSRGSGLMTNSGQSLGSGSGTGAALGDLDGDGDLDAFVANYSGVPNYVWTNDGSGKFFDSGQRFGTDWSTDVALGDLDGDGDLDAFVCNPTGSPWSLQIWSNNGHAVFAQSWIATGQPGYHAALADFDGDGDLDAMVANYLSDYPCYLWVNDGHGQFSDSGQRLIAGLSTWAAAGDVDGDGDLDALLANNSAGRKLWLNDGRGFFADSGQTFSNAAALRTGLGDVDGDGDLDAVIINGTDGSRVWRNNGNGVFTDSGQLLQPGQHYALALGDLDADLDLDLTLTSSDGAQVWTNNGTGLFGYSNQKLSAGYQPEDVAMGDVNGDGDLDIFLAIWNGPNAVWLNAEPDLKVLGRGGQAIGSGADPDLAKGTDFGPLWAGEVLTNRFAITNGSVCVLGVSNATITGSGAAAFSVIGLPAVVAAGSASNFAIAFHPYGSGTYTAAVAVANNSLTDPYLIRLRGAQALSVTSTEPRNAERRVPTNAEVAAWVNGSGLDTSSVTAARFLLHSGQRGYRQGSIRFNPERSMTALQPDEPFAPGELVMAELASGITAGNGSVPLLPHLWSFHAAAPWGSGVFSNSGQALSGIGYATAVSLGDLDGDRDLDAYVVQDQWQPDFIWLNNGAGQFTDSGQRLGSARGTGVALGDLDRDGDLDAFVCALSGGLEVWSNNAHAAFGLRQAMGGMASYHASLGDFDGDGDLDAFVGNIDSPACVWTNDGQGAFGDSGQRLGASNERTYGAAVGDVDGDGDLDVLTATDGQGNKLWRNDGHGVFVQAQLLGAVPAFRVPLLDVDGDGDLDAVLSISGANGGCQVWTNNGAGSFADSGQRFGTAGYMVMLPGDLDADGDLDLILTTTSNGAEIWRNDGTGHFAATGQLLYGGRALYDAAAGDVDGDGDIDAFLAAYGDVATVWLNRFAYRIVASAGLHGTISPLGDIPVLPGGATNFLVRADPYFYIGDVRTNGASIIVTNSYSIIHVWSNVLADGTIQAGFDPRLAAHGTPYWWLAHYGLTNTGMTFDEAETNNPDGDPHRSEAEYIADTDPTLPSSHFYITRLNEAWPVTVYFMSSSNRFYTMCGASDLAGGGWTNLPGLGPRIGLGGADSMTHTGMMQRGFFRVEVAVPSGLK